jgi:hypothetical protein
VFENKVLRIIFVVGNRRTKVEMKIRKELRNFILHQILGRSNQGGEDGPYIRYGKAMREDYRELSENVN